MIIFVLGYGNYGMYLASADLRETHERWKWRFRICGSSTFVSFASKRVDIGPIVSIPDSLLIHILSDVTVTCCAMNTKAIPGVGPIASSALVSVAIYDTELIPVTLRFFRQMLHVD
jgi:hypothetical protein